MKLSEELERSLREFVAAGPVEVREAARRLAPLSALNWEIRGAADRPLLHLWSEHHNLTRRVLSISENSGDRLVLSVQRFGRTKPDRLEFVRQEFELSAKDLSREEFRDRLAQLLAQQFPDETLESLSVAPDLEHSFSGNYARGTLRRGSARWAVLGMPDSAAGSGAEQSLTFALLWLDRVRQSAQRGVVAGLRLILPHGTRRGVTHRVEALDPRLAIELYEHNPEWETLQRIDLPRAATLSSWLVPVRDAQALIAQAKPALEAVLAASLEATQMNPAPETREVFLRFRGLAIARWEEGHVYFGAGDPREELSPGTQPRLKKLFRDLELYRNALATDTQHPLYRAQPERWLESLVREEITRIDAALDSRFVYTQVFAASGGGSGVIDVLGVTRTGRLAVIELKADEHIHLPLQAAEYWLRVHRHHAQGDFARYGYFPGIELLPTPPLVYLVAPALRFHPSTDTLLRFLSPEIEVVRVGLAEDWRRGLRVAMRQ